MKEPCLQIPCLIGQIYFINIGERLTFACVILIIAEFNFFFLLLRQLGGFLLSGETILRINLNI